jgi:hypothetical protein
MKNIKNEKINSVTSAPRNGQFSIETPAKSQLLRKIKNKGSRHWVTGNRILT